MIDLKDMKDKLLAEMTSDQSDSLDNMLECYMEMLGLLGKYELSDRECLLTVTHTLVRCVRIVNGTKEQLLEDVGGMYDMLTLLETKTEGSVQ